mmetsp:Transcript_14249/g.22188  ORF Transcript_14249/g.22188 Transcript_14249/m.22188 type:complete len:130 (+) Transcript_14249:1606-1995(+)|eukprot:CAMPEP_0170489328 /NCGR_PEP_ID=MMETSP0208-20121228/7684_1 /TAXON_ID=197538 /ORGANISM="Strombidium inclinatum, Strain S3" /LENGTH=129 /DNA_ID=CAMNT_0010764191 /DNA_START=1549 /DNA_END=1938 /DNA_ORIENTATION=-
MRTAEAKIEQPSSISEPRAFKIITESEILKKHKVLEPSEEERNETNLDEPVQNLSDYEEHSAVGGGKSTRESRPIMGSPFKKEERVLHMSKPRSQFEHAAATYKAEVKDLMRRKESKQKREASPLIDHN